MTFDELYERLRGMAEDNRQKGFRRGHLGSWPRSPVETRVFALYPDDLELLVESLSALRERDVALTEAATRFVIKVENGRARSTQSYNEFKTALTKGPQP